VQRGRALLARGQAADAAVGAALAAVARARAHGDDYRVALADAGARTLAAAVAVAAHQPAAQPLADARAAVARTLALTHEETPALKAFTVELDALSRSQAKQKQP
jgi:hypothetical protein